VKELVVNVIAPYAADLLTDIAVGAGLKKLSKLALERWSRSRATEFYQTLIWHLSQDAPDLVEVDARLDRLLKGNATSEVIFDAYRAVSLSRSKTLGPRVIAVLTGQIIQRNPPVATELEDAVFAAAETLTDVDFQRFLNTMEKAIAMETGGRGNSGSPDEKQALEYMLPMPSRNQLPAFFARRSGTQTIVIENSLAATLGLWAERLRAIGLISEVRTNRLKTTEDETQFATAVFGRKPSAEWKIRFNDGAHLLRAILRIVMPQAGGQSQPAPSDDTQSETNGPGASTSE